MSLAALSMDLRCRTAWRRLGRKIKPGQQPQAVGIAGGMRANRVDLYAESQTQPPSALAVSRRAFRDKRIAARLAEQQRVVSAIEAIARLDGVDRGVRLLALDRHWLPQVVEPAARLVSAKAWLGTAGKRPLKLQAALAAVCPER